MMLLGVWDKRWLCCGVCETMITSVNGRKRNVEKWKKRKEWKKSLGKERKEKKEQKEKNQVKFEFVFVLWLWDLLSNWAMLSLFDTYSEMRIELGTCCCGDWRNLGVFRFPDF